MQNAKQTPLYDRHVSQGGKMVEYGGWLLPIQYSAILAECKAVREGCGLFDVSHMGEVTVKGPGARDFLNLLLTNDFSAMEDGRCRYSPMCYDNGGVVDDLLVYKRGDGDYLLIVNAANTAKDFEWIAAHVGEGVTVENVSDRYAQLALQGPAYREVLAKLPLEGTLPEKGYTFTENMRIGDRACLVSKTGYTGEPGVEIYLAPEDAGPVYDLLLEAGATPCGLGARDTLRFECSMPLYGHELGPDITPLECGLNPFVKMNKPDFIGKKALEDNPPKRKRIGLELVDRGIAREHCPVLDASGNIVGETTSGGPAPTLGKNVAMALVYLDAAELDAFYVEVRGRKLQAKRVPMPFFKSSNK